MKLNILAFGIAKDIVGTSVFPFEVAENVLTVSELQSKLNAQFPRFLDLTSLFIAVNNEYADPSTILNEKDEIVLIPPVAGG